MSSPYFEKGEKDGFKQQLLSQILSPQMAGGEKELQC